jgi:hypothetical protein
MDESQVVQASCDQNWYHYLQFWIHRADGGTIQEQLQVEKSHLGTTNQTTPLPAGLRIAARWRHAWYRTLPRPQKSLQQFN